MNECAGRREGGGRERLRLGRVVQRERKGESGQRAERRRTGREGEKEGV